MGETVTPAGDVEPPVDEAAGRRRSAA